MASVGPNGRQVGFFLEYDRGTEGARDYAGKWAAYYTYRDSGRAAQDYTDFPTILVVTAGPEEPVVRSARAAAACRPAGLPILVTTSGWVEGHPEGILGPIWRTPGQPGRRPLAPASVTAGIRAPQLLWPTERMLAGVCPVAHASVPAGVIIRTSRHLSQTRLE